MKEIGKEDLISGHGIIKSNPDKSKHLETVTFKIFGYDIDVANLRNEEYANNSRIPTMVLLISYKLALLNVYTKLSNLELLFKTHREEILQ